MRKILFLSVLFALMATASWAQRTVTGKVTDEKNTPLANVTVQVKNTNIGTVTKDNGTYSITVPSNGRVLVFSFADMGSQELNIGNLGVINATLTSSANSLENVVVVGYGTQRRKEVGGSVATVKGGAVADKPVQSFDQALAGRAAGVQITVPSGVLNSPPVFRIRGTNSISLSSYPLIIVDGVPTFTGDFSSTNAAGNALASINPNDIESIDIAKDAAATAIYGSRAANGVVFITTKKGRPGRAKVSYNGSVSWTKAYGIPKVLDAFQYTDYKNMAAANNQNVNTTNPLGLNYVKFNLATDANGQVINTNWADLVYREGFSHFHNLNVQGGTDNTTYYLSLGYTNQEGILKKNDFIRKNILFNLDSRINNVLTVGGKISFSNEENLAATTSGSLAGEAFNTGGLGRLVLVNAPNVGPYKNDGTYNIAANNVVGSMNNTPAQVGFYNPVPILALNRSNSEGMHIQSNFYVQLKPVSWLTLRTLYGIDYVWVDNDIFQTPLHGDGFAAIGNASSNLTKNKRWTWSNTAQADYTFAKEHNVSLLVGQEQDRRTSLGYGLNRQQISDPVYTVIQAGFGLNNTTNTVGALGENYLLSGFGRLNYDYSKKYFFSANLRQDEYSAFAGKKQIFYGLSVAWDLSKENFWKGSLDNTFNNFRIHGSYGKVGNTAGIPDFAIYSTFGSGLYGGNSTLIYNQAGNKNLQWETSKKTDVGFSFGMLKDRLNLDFAWYNNDISDLILSVPQAPSAGLPTNVLQNVGTMYNKGIELTLTGTPVRTKNFTWNSSFNITYNKNEVTSLAPGLSEVLTASSGLETVSRTAVGYSLGYIWVVKTGGVDPQTGRRILLDKAGNKVLYQFAPPAGQFNYSNPDGTKYVGPTGNTTVNQAADGQMVGNVLPKEYGGWDNTFRYKGFDLNVLMTYQAGFYVYYGSHAGLFDQRFWNNSVEVLNAWKKPGDITNVPRPVYTDNVSNGSGLPMDFNVFKGDFIKLKNVGIGYTIPASLLGKAKISSLRVYVSGQNLHIFTKYPGPDPEVSSNGNGATSQGIDRNTIANARNWVAGVNIGF